LAAPVRDASGEVAGAVSIGGLSPLILDPEGIDPPPPLLTDLLACCAEISERLGGPHFTE
jgi:DNA-binding IclR family transcriptional regulator